MKLFIPPCGYRVRLTKDWKFELYFEYRNDSLVESIMPEETTINDKWNWHYERDEDGHYHKIRHAPATIPSGTVLEVDRVYIRAFSKSAKSKEDDYDSVTFRVVEHSGWAKTKKGVRFWAKLCDVNEIEYEVPPEASVKDRPKKPAKLTPEKIVRILNTAVMYDNYHRSHGDEQAPWLTRSLIKGLEEMSEVYECRMKSAYPAQRCAHTCPHDYFMAYKFLPRTKRHFRRTPDGCARDFVGYDVKTAIEMFGKGTFNVDMSDMWITVFTNAEDTEITGVECGMTKK